MKNFKILGLLLCLFAVNAWGAELTPTQKKAQVALYKYLEKEQFKPQVDEKDNSLCIRQDGVLYWITFSGESPILYTFNRTGYKVGTGEKQYKRTPAIVAANEVNRTHPGVKLTVGEKNVRIAIEVFMADPEHFSAVFRQYLKMFDGVDADFKKAYSHALRMETEAAERMENEMRKNLPPSKLRDKIENVSFRLVDEAGEETTAYDKALRSFNAYYVQARIEFKPWAEPTAEYTIQMKIYRPDGKPVYFDGHKYTAQETIQINKSKKPQLVEFNKAGSSENGFWKGGEYKVELLEGGDVIYTTTFTML